MKTRTTLLLTVGLFLAGSAAATDARAAGAVVIAPDRSVVFWSVHQPEVGVAVDRALHACAARFGGGCSVFQSFNSGCMAVARSPGHNHWGYALRDNPHDARFAAIGSCAQFAPDCHTQTVSCE